MPETDMVVRDLKLNVDGVFDFKELYNLIKDWYSLHKYDFYEKNYKEVLKEEAKDIKIEFTGDRVIDYYIKYIIDITIRLNNHKIVKGPNNKNLVQGNLSISFQSKLQTDFEASWEGKPLLKFTRGLYDKFVRSDKLDVYKKELKEQSYEIFNEIKAYLNLHKF